MILLVIDDNETIIHLIESYNFNFIGFIGLLSYTFVAVTYLIQRAILNGILGNLVVG